MQDHGCSCPYCEGSYKKLTYEVIVGDLYSVINKFSEEAVEWDDETTCAFGKKKTAG